eukprot:TRINITY_DN719_c0_g1_i1.p1 TRINITY_DN719_c0_g1~~TRINITY_DN719_c0_g1_i1.p1  ORF type:complete len:716 (-),score=152.87 TRINITY_DN719_c0_g1_i1:99-2246(-)
MLLCVFFFFWFYVLIRSIYMVFLLFFFFFFKNGETTKSSFFFFFFFNDTATTEIYTRSIVGSVRCVQETVAVYCAAVLQNFGNYLSFGDCKFVPAIPDEKFLLIIQCSEAFKLHEALIMDIWNNISKIMYLNDVPHKIIGFKDHNGCNTYYSANILKDEAEEIKEYQESIGVSPLNTRLVKFDSKKYALRIASSQKDTSLAYLKTHEFKGKQIVIENGEFAPFLKRAVDNLTKCVEFCANDIQVKMMKDYIEHFTHGDNNKHKDSQRMWIRDINPSVEANIGFTETYVDPLGVRAEFEGWVSVVNKEESKKLNNLVHNADGLVAMLPWNKYFEKDKFKKPDFTALDVVTFACSDIPTGINLPNYDDVKESDGYKNVSLSNSYFVPTSKNINFVPEEDIPTCIKYYKDGRFLHVALHELLGHGSGRLIQEDEKGNISIPSDLINPYTKKPVCTYYKSNETWESKFGYMHSAYEECRADCVALYLSCFEEPMKILFEGRDKEWDDIRYMCWMHSVIRGIEGLEHYNAESKKWMQAHMNSAHVIFEVLLEAGEGLVTVIPTKKDGKDYVQIKLDKAKILTVGKKALGEFLNKLHVCKSCGDLASGTALFSFYSKVNEEMLKNRVIALAHKIPRRLALLGNLFKDKEGKITYKAYDTTFEGIMQSFIERYGKEFDQEMYDFWKAERDLYNPLLHQIKNCLLYTSPSPRDLSTSRMPSSA